MYLLLVSYGFSYHKLVSFAADRARVTRRLNVWGVFQLPLLIRGLVFNLENTVIFFRFLTRQGLFRIYWSELQSTLVDFNHLKKMFQQRSLFLYSSSSSSSLSSSFFWQELLPLNLSAELNDQHSDGGSIGKALTSSGKFLGASNTYDFPRPVLFVCNIPQRKMDFKERCRSDSCNLKAQ